MKTIDQKYYVAIGDPLLYLYEKEKNSFPAKYTLLSSFSDFGRLLEFYICKRIDDTITIRDLAVTRDALVDGLANIRRIERELAEEQRAGKNAYPNKHKKRSSKSRPNKRVSGQGGK